MTNKELIKLLKDLYGNINPFMDSTDLYKRYKDAILEFENNNQFAVPLSDEEFGEWKEERYNYDGKNDNGEMLYVCRVTGKFHTTEELYKLFKNRNNG